MRRRAIFIDQDETLCEDLGVASPERVRLAPGAGAAVQRLNTDGWQVVVVCECPAIARGELDEDTLADIHERLRLELLAENARVDGIYHCPHHPEGDVERYRRTCTCRRPGTGLYERARDEMGIDLSRSFLLTGSEPALRSAVSAGIRPIVVRPENGRAIEDGSRAGAAEADRPLVVDTIDEAVRFVLSEGTPSKATAR